MVILDVLKNAGKKIGQREASLVLRTILNKNALELVICKNNEINEKDREAIEKAVERIYSGEPLQYVLGSTEFMSLPFMVNPCVLIPRSDTESLVEYIIANTSGGETVLDIGTGSGCIAVSIAHYVKNSRVTAMDISDGALRTASENAKLNNVDISFVKHDIMKDFEGKFDIIVSNPPYIEKDIIPTLDKNVKDFEPITALDGGIDGLDFYRRITSIAPKMLNKNGLLCFEVGHTQAETVKKLMETKFNIEIIKDLCGINRVVAGRLIGDC